MPFPPLPRNLVIPDGTGRFLANAGTLVPSGSPLVVSNSPEQVTQRLRGAGDQTIILHRTAAPGWRFRLFYHHQLVTRTGLFAGFALINRGTLPLEAYVARSSGPSQSRDPAVAGLSALQRYFGSRTFRPEADHYLGTIDPGGAQFVTDWLDRGVSMSGLFDLALRDPSGTSPADRQPPVTVVMLADRFAGSGSPDRKRALIDALLHHPIATPDPVRQQRTRATFAHADRQGTIGCEIGPEQNAGPQFVDLAGPYFGSDARPLPGEFERPQSPRALGALPEGSPGNYGVLYDLRIALTNRLSVSVGVTCLLNAAGGMGGSVLVVDNVVQSPRTILKAFDSWVWQEVTLAPGGTRATSLRFSLPGGANGAHRLFFWPHATS
jgi:hypothetical protein